MTDCATNCGRPTRDVLALCITCMAELEQALAELPKLLDDLDITLTRQSRISQPNGGSTARSAQRPVPYHVKASDIGGETRAVLAGWVRVVAEDEPGRYPDDNPKAMCAWLVSRIDMLARHEAAAEMYTEITDQKRKIERVTDRPADQLYAGTCGSEVSPDPSLEPGDGTARGYSAHWRCDEPLYARPNTENVTCRACGIEHQVSARREKMLTDLDDKLVTAAEFAQLAAYLLDDAQRKREQTRKLINQWHTRGLLTRHSDSPEGEPRFVFADIKILLARDQARREQRAGQREAS